jgi:NTE family protein
MEVTDFTHDVFNLVENLREHIAERNKKYSDIIDDDGLQYVDIVMEGGGVLGIALVGFTYVLEQVGIRFLQIGGASAGAINALLLAGLGLPAEIKSEKVLKELAEVDMYSFVDGDEDAKDFIDAWLKHGSQNFSTKSGNIRNFVDKLFNETSRYYIFTQGAQVIDSIRNQLGLNPGRKFQQWVEDVLENAGIKTTIDLYERLHSLPASLRHRDPGVDLANFGPTLALIAADVSTQTKVIFPKMAELYWEKPEEVNPSHYVRASMSIPFFFEPYRVKKVPQGEAAMRCWRSLANYQDPLPKTCTFIDGGIMSNFPINLFHRPDRIPFSPTFGVKLGADKKLTGDITTPFTLISVIFDSARFNLDNDFIARNPDYRKLVSCIDTGEHNWLNFNLTDEAKRDLFRRGAMEADRFMREFDWHEYKELRRGIAQGVKKANIPMEIVAGDAATTPTE